MPANYCHWSPDSMLLAGAILYPNCATAHPRKVLLAGNQRRSTQVVFFERTEVSKLLQCRTLDRRGRSSPMHVMYGKSDGPGGRRRKSKLGCQPCTALVLACGGLSQSVANLPTRTLHSPWCQWLGKCSDQSHSQRVAAASPHLRVRQPHVVE